MARPKSVSTFKMILINILYLLGRDTKKLAKEYNVSERTIYRYVRK
jgi:transposase|tara:strand:- start:733 stop:870 length:138 start_codon:yes stop_codon:yes gene_type:complete